MSELADEPPIEVLNAQMAEFTAAEAARIQDITPEPVKEEPMAKTKELPRLADHRDPSTFYETAERVTMSAPGYPGFVITGDRTYYKVRYVETDEGIVGEIDVHPGMGHVSELRLVNAGRDHQIK